jgi:hypothetical protein
MNKSPIIKSNQIKSVQVWYRTLAPISPSQIANEPEQQDNTGKREEEAKSER